MDVNSWILIALFLFFYIAGYKKGVSLSSDSHIPSFAKNVLSLYFTYLKTAVKIKKHLEKEKNKPTNELSQ